MNCVCAPVGDVPDEIAIRGFIGHLEEGGFLPHNHKVYLWAHLHFNIEYNGENVSLLTVYLSTILQNCTMHISTRNCKNMELYVSTIPWNCAMYINIKLWNMNEWVKMEHENCTVSVSTISWNHAVYIFEWTSEIF